MTNHNLLKSYLREAIPRGVTRSLRSWTPGPITQRDRWGSVTPDSAWDEGLAGDELDEKIYAGLPEEVVNVLRKWTEKGQMGFKGRGTSRVVFSIPGGKVLKVALNQAGMAQNQSEARLSKNSVLQPYIARVWKSSPDGKWLIMEEVQEDSGVGYEVLGVNPPQEPDDTGEYPDDAEMGELVDLAALPVRDWERYHREGMINRWQLDLLHAIKKAGLNTNDAFRPDHWGRTHDGKPALMDFGATHDVLAQHYQGL